MTFFSLLPAIEALLNGTSAVLLTAGWLCIRAGKIAAHSLLMVAAFGVSALFLICYVVHHAHAGTVRFAGTGWIRPVYVAMLVTHTILAVVILPLVLRTLFLARRRRFTDHARVGRRTLPLWLYVSVTGVLIYWMLYRVAWKP